MQEDESKSKPWTKGLCSTRMNFRSGQKQTVNLLNVRKKDWMSRMTVNGKHRSIRCISWPRLCLGNPAHRHQHTMKCARAPQIHNTLYGWKGYCACLCAYSMCTCACAATVRKGLDGQWLHVERMHVNKWQSVTNPVYCSSGVSSSLMLHMHCALPRY